MWTLLTLTLTLTLPVNLDAFDGSVDVCPALVDLDVAAEAS